MTLTEAIAQVETRHLNQARPHESVVQETASPVGNSAAMKVDPEVGLSLSGKRTAVSKPTFADVVAYWNTSVFKLTPTEAVALPSQYSISQGQSEATFVTPTVLVKSRPI